MGVQTEPVITLGAPVRLPALDPSLDGHRPGPGDPARVAVIVCHGMGQQVRFETLMDLARVLERAKGIETRDGVVARSISIGEEGRRVDTHRVELTLGQGDAKKEVHLYEAYWAPLTEGKVSGADVVSFLWSAAIDGWRNAGKTTFSRWMFGRSVSMPIKATSTRRRLLGALLIVLSLITINAAVFLLGVSRILEFQHRWPGSVHVKLAAVEILILFGLAGLAALGISIAQKGRTRRQPPTSLAWFGIWGALGGMLLVAVAVIAQAIFFIVRPPSNDPIPPGEVLALLASWLVLIAISRRIRDVLVQYVGDVVVYVSAHRLGKFCEVREAIQKASCGVARGIYTAMSTDRTRFEYGRVMVVGHSLGSVVAYDTLNAMIREDRAAATPFDAVSRTPLLLTFGSPLNKTAFIFRTQMPEGSELREALAASVQPMIQSYDLRPEKWLNIYSPADWISGRLEFYDDPEVRNHPKRVQNEVDTSATTPLLAHTEYWRGGLLSRRLTEAILAYDDLPDSKGLSGPLGLLGSAARK